jgi:hypothetical protein
MAPKQAEIPNGRELNREGLLKFKPGPPPPPTAPKPVKAGTAAPVKTPVAVRIDDSDHEDDTSSLVHAGPSKPKPKKVKAKTEEPRETKTATLTSWSCPGCSANRLVAHEDGCDFSSTPWGKMSKEEKAARKRALSGKTDEEPEKATTDEKSVPRINKVDPLKVDDKLSKGEDAKLRKFFGMEAPPKPSELEGLDAKAKAALLKRSQLPKWAVAAALADRVNIGSICSGELTLEKFQAGLFSRKSKKATQDKIVTEWTAIKAKFDGVSLLEKPKSPKEKEFLKEYTLLKKRHGDHPCLPKPKKASGGGSGRQSPRPSQNQGRSQPSESSSLLEMMKTMAEIMKALK